MAHENAILGMYRKTLRPTQIATIRHEGIRRLVTKGDQSVIKSKRLVDMLAVISDADELDDLRSPADHDSHALMKPRRSVLGLLGALGGALSLGGCGLLGGNSYRFRLTIAVDTPAGPRTCSGVLEVRARNEWSPLPDMADRSWQVTGEAVAVDLPGGRTLFALLKTQAHFEDMMGLSMNTLYPDFRGTGYDVVGVAGELSRRSGGKPVAVAPADYPLLVTFADLNDPASVALVDPANLAAQFGPGTALRGITVQLTDDPVTSGIQGRLGWLKAVGRERGALIPPSDSRLLKDKTEIQRVTPGDFSTELYK